jgi:hypothetical protein
VEWAYLWNTEEYPVGTIVGDNINVRAIAYNATAANARKDTNPSDNITYAQATNANAAIRDRYNIYNPGFANTMPRYNEKAFTLRPYITGFLRNQAQFSNNTRSRQGRYMFYRGETAVVTGFNLGGGDTTATNINLPGMGSVAAAAVGTIGDFGITTANNARYRQFTVTAGNAATGDGVVTLSVTRTNAYPAVNTGTAAGERGRADGTPVRPRAILPWNIEYSPGTDGSDLWDDFTQVHIWQSDTTATGNDRGRFAKQDNLSVMDPSMSIDPATPTLWSSHNEGGGAGWNAGTAKVSSNSGGGWNNTTGTGSGYLIGRAIDPLINSDVYISTQAGGGNAFTVWTAYSVIGRAGTPGSWSDYGGVFVTGPQGGRPLVNDVEAYTSNSITANNGFENGAVSARSQYIVESTGYNAGTATASTTNWPPGNIPDTGPTRNQFMNPHIVTWYGAGTLAADTANSEHIHVSYYDTKDGSLKYRYNRRGGYGTVAFGTSATTNTQHYAWTNLDGGYDLDDRNTFNADNNTNWATATGGGYYKAPYTTYTAAIAQNERIVDYATRSTRAGQTNDGGKGPSIVDAGEYNSIALTNNGYPVVAYYDKTNQKLKLAISSATVPIRASLWTIQDVFPGSGDGIQNRDGTGQYVSMKIDTRNGANIVHIAAMNSTNKNLVYIRGTLSGTAFTYTRAQVVDSVGSVGRWCSLSLDENGNPWISYQDESYQGSRDGVKMAYYNAAAYYKGSAAYRNGEDTDINGVAVTGWEAMHIPTRFRVDNARTGMECYPARNFTGTLNPATKFWGGAVGYLGQDYYRVAYYVK